MLVMIGSSCNNVCREVEENGKQDAKVRFDQGEIVGGASEQGADEGFPIVMEQFWLLRNTVARHVTAVKPSWPGVSAS